MLRSIDIISTMESGESAVQSELMGDQLPIYLLSIGISLGMSVAMFFLSNYMCKKKLNLL